MGPLELSALTGTPNDAHIFLQTSHFLTPAAACITAFGWSFAQLMHHWNVFQVLPPGASASSSPKVAVPGLPAEVGRPMQSSHGLLLGGGPLKDSALWAFAHSEHQRFFVVPGT